MMPTTPTTPTTPQKPDLDNHGKQLNPNNPEYQRSRGQPQPQPQNPTKKP